MTNRIQANLKPETVQRISDISNRPVTRGIDKMINECLDKIDSQNNGKGVGKCSEMMELLDNGKETQ